MNEIFGLWNCSALAVMCIYAILVLLYNNFLSTDDYGGVASLGGALLGLMVAQKHWGCMR